MTERSDSKSEISQDVIESVKKRKANSTAMTNFATKPNGPPPIPLPHLVYQIDFIENDSNNIWNGNHTSIINNILQEAKVSIDEAQKGNGKKKESKVIVVLELPVGGSVSKYSIGHTDDTLEIEIQKHSLMLNPKALLLSGLATGVLDLNTDGPHTARGGIRLNECAKALQLYQQKENLSGKKAVNTMTLKFDLPDFIDRDKIKHYSYCFEKSQDNPLQYSITYFEFDVKDAKDKEEDNKYETASSMFFSDNPTSGNAPAPNNGANNNNAHSSSTSSNRNTTNVPGASNANHNKQQNASTNATIAPAANEDVEMVDNNAAGEKEKVGKTYSQADFEHLRSEMMKELNYREKQIEERYVKDRLNYASSLKKNFVDIRQQKTEMKRQIHEKEKEIEEKNTLIDAQRIEITSKENSLLSVHGIYRDEIARLEKELFESEKARQDMKNSLIPATAPRVIHTHPDYTSVAKQNGGLTPSKRLRKLETVEDEAQGHISQSSSSHSATINDSFESDEDAVQQQTTTTVEA